VSGEIKFDENKMRLAIDHMRRGAKELRQTIHQTQGLAGLIEKGALVGEAGTQFQTIIKSTLNSKIEEIATKLEEQARFMEIELEQLIKAASKLR
jgi:hypothetical protein